MRHERFDSDQPTMLYRAATPTAADPNEFILSDETVDRYGDVINADGWDLRTFRSNPIALFNHSANAIIGRWERVRVEGTRLLGRLVLAAAGTSDLVDSVRSLWDQNILRGVSVGFRPVNMEPLDDKADEDFGPFRFLKQQLLEASLVAIPANPNALPVARSFALSAEVTRQLFGKPATRKLRLPSDPRVAATPPTGGKAVNLSKRIESAQRELTDLRNKLTELSTIEEPDADQSELIDELTDNTIPAAEETLKRLERMEKALAIRTTDPANPNPPNPEPGDPRRPFALPKKKIEPADFVFRAIAVGVRAFTNQVSLDRALADMYSGDEGTVIVLKAAVNPAMTTVAGYAAELVQTANAAFLDRLIAESIYGPLSAMGARYDLGRNGTIKIPTRASSPKASGAWVGEGAPKPVKRIGLGSVSLTPHKLAVITTFTEEMAMYSTPAIEGLLRQAMADDTSESLDGYLIDNVAASANRPAGLLNGVTPLTPSAAATASAAMVADMKALVSAIVTAGGGRSIAVLINPIQAMGLGFAQTTTGDFLFESTDQAGNKFMVRFIPSRTVPAGTLIAVDAADFATVTGDTPRFAVSTEATLHEEDTTPQPIGSTGTPNVVAAPVRSLFQTDSLAVRLSLYLTWGMRRTGMVATMSGVIW